jgi:cyclase
MLQSRIIPVLLMKDGALIKGRKFEDYKYVGDPINAVKIFNEKEVDELCLFDIGAWRSETINFDLLQRIARESRMPLTYGGGICNADSAREIIRLGFEKVSVSRAAIEQPDIVREISRKIGSQSCVVTIDVRRDSTSNSWKVYTENGHRASQHDLVTFLTGIQSAGAGEIIVNSIDREGEMIGYDLELARVLDHSLAIPFTVCGGAGSFQHIRDLIDTVGTVGAAVGTFFTFRGRFRSVLITYGRP